MNSNNLENEKLPESMEGMAEETTDQLPQEEKVSEEPVEILSGEPLEAEKKVTEPEEAETEPVKDTEAEEVPESDLKTEEAVAGEESEINYDIETPENVDTETEDTEEEDENNVSDDDTTELLAVEEIVQKLRDLLASDHPQRREVDEVKNQFYRSLRNETESQKAAFIESGGESIDFVVNESEIYAEGKELIQKIKEKRAAILAREDAEKEKNVAKKMAIIDQVRHLAENQSQEDFNKTYQEFRSLQQQWNEIKLVPQTKVNELWKEYQRHVEKFYDLVRINIFAGNDTDRFPLFLDGDHFLRCFFPILTILQCFGTFTQGNFLFQVFLHFAVHRFVEIVFVAEKEVAGGTITVVNLRVPLFGDIAYLTPLFLNIKNILDLVIPIPNGV